MAREAVVILHVEDEVEVTSTQGSAEPATASDLDVDPQARIMLGTPRQIFGHEAVDAVGRDADLDHALGVGVGHHAVGLVVEAEDAARIGKQACPLLRQPFAAADPDEQAAPDQCFEPLHLLRDGRLGPVDRLCSGAKMLALGDGGEGSQQRDVEVLLIHKHLFRQTG